jgi:hypothetical protein
MSSVNSYTYPAIIKSYIILSCNTKEMGTINSLNAKNMCIHFSIRTLYVRVIDRSKNFSRSIVPQ